MSGPYAIVGVEQAHPRLVHLYEISKLFAAFDAGDQTFDPVLSIVARTLPLRSAILIERGDDVATMIVWSCEGQTPEQLQAVKEHAGAAYTYLLGPESIESLGMKEQAGLTVLPPQAGIRTTRANRFIVIPLVVAHRPPFGTLQLEGAQRLDEADLMYVNAVANQLAIALDRERAWRRDIVRRKHAEEGQTYAEVRGATAERGRLDAENESDRYEALAAENARLYEQARQAVRGREQILAIVSHDLKNPLGTILMTTDVLSKRTVSVERRRGLPQAIGRIQRSAERMLRLIADLLDFASIEAGSLAIRRKPQDPESILQETIASFEGIALERDLTLTADVQPNPPKVFCDRDRILQVLSNLVGNATNATPGGGAITLRVEGQEHELLFEVSDNGPGISEEDVAHLFDRYWRSSDAEYKGSGLGLAISRGIVSAHGGRMWVESELGHGAKFLFTIPAADETSLFAVPTREDLSHINGSSV